MYAEYTQPQLTLLELLPCKKQTIHLSSVNDIRHLFIDGAQSDFSQIFIFSENIFL